MKIKLKQKYLKSPCITGHLSAGLYLAEKELQVFAVMKNYGGLRYLVRYSIADEPEMVDWLLAKHIYITDATKPNNWVEYHWSFLHPYMKINEKYRDFKFKLTYYCGPAEIFYDEDFLFESIDNCTNGAGFLNRYL